MEDSIFGKTDNTMLNYAVCRSGELGSNQKGAWLLV
jgi:hypothetical protein